MTHYKLKFESIISKETADKLEALTMGDPNTQEVLRAISDSSASRLPYNQDDQDEVEDLHLSMKLDTLIALLSNSEFTHIRQERCWTEFICDDVIKRLEERSNEYLNEASTSELVESLYYNELASETFTNSTAQSLDYIRDFWSDFKNPSYVEDMLFDGTKDSIFTRPELFFVYIFVEELADLLNIILEDNTDVKTTDDLIRLLSSLDAYALNDYFFEN
ncbi:MAG: hypothetical protein D8H99_14965 [Streptococcus sp.]|nr:MAG: hypothetical protein D8H99_14965 [Streptococcus sp.]